MCFPARGCRGWMWAGVCMRPHVCSGVCTHMCVRVCHMLWVRGARVCECVSCVSVCMYVCALSAHAGVCSVTFCVDAHVYVQECVHSACVHWCKHMCALWTPVHALVHSLRAGILCVHTSAHVHILQCVYMLCVCVYIVLLRAFCVFAVHVCAHVCIM